MALRIFNKKAKEEKKQLKEQEKKPEKRALLLETSQGKRTGKKKSFENWQVLKAPHVTEKAADLVGKNQYVFKIFPDSNKNDVKKSVESIYNVEVLSVRVINIPSKKRRMGRTIGRKPGYKKAIVKLKEGQKIEILPR